MRIVAKGRQIKVEVNDTVVVDVNLDDFKKEHAKTNPGILRNKGHIGLQSQAGRVEFRGLYLKELE